MTIQLADVCMCCLLNPAVIFSALRVSEGEKTAIDVALWRPCYDRYDLRISVGWGNLRSAVEIGSGALPVPLAIVSRAQKVFGDAGKAERWLRTPITALNGQRPCDCARTGDIGREQVLSVLDRIESGTFS